MLKLKAIDLKKEKAATLVIPVCEDRQIHADQTVSALVKRAKTIKEFRGRKDDEIVLYNLPGGVPERIIFFGLGKLEKIDAETMRSFAGRAVKKSIAKDLADICIAVPDVKKIKMEPVHLLEAMLEGGFLANHLFDRYKKEKKKKPVKKILLLTTPETAKKYSRLPSRVSAVCRGTLSAREWIDTPSNDKRPQQFAKSIVAAAKKAGLGVDVLDEKALKQKKFGAMLAVAAGSNDKPRLVVLTYAPKNAKKTVALVGKGVTFDAGGINLKPTGSIETMKTDMSGAAAVAGAMIATAKLKPKMKVIGVLPIVENMPSGSATRPGDIIKTFDGKTVEIGNTDAEGRLILIDAMSYTIGKYKPDIVIDLATLTGACVVALGEKIAGVFSNDEALARAIVASGQKTHERCWRMPLPEDYHKLLKSDIADISNMSSTRWGGAITAALFLKEFVGETRWAHIDIAGPARGKKATDYCSAGGTGFGVRLLCDLLGKLCV